jgi:uncharacterized membrane protein YfcA
MQAYLWLLPVGVAIGVLGTLIGAGGGFLLLPLLLLVYPHEEPEVLTSISLAVVALNALSGSISYARLQRIDWRAGLIFAGAGLPGAVLGALTTTVVPRQLFGGLLGATLLAAAVSLLWRPGSRPLTAPRGQPTPVAAAGGPSVLSVAPGYVRPLGATLSFAIGYFSSMLGIGGGILHVPALVRLLRFPVHTATATSHFVLAVLASGGVLTHVFTGAFHHGARRTLFLGLGVLVGAPVGAAISGRVRGDWIVRALGIGLGLVAVRLLLGAVR